jgi:hypothetical protein
MLFPWFLAGATKGYRSSLPTHQIRYFIKASSIQRFLIFTDILIFCLVDSFHNRMTNLDLFLPSELPSERD